MRLPSLAAQGRSVELQLPLIWKKQKRNNSSGSVYYGPGPVLNTLEAHLLFIPTLGST